MVVSPNDTSSEGGYLIPVEQVLDRIELAKRRSRKDMNCVGTALYILGAQDEEVYVRPYRSLGYMGAGYKGILEPAPSRDAAVIQACLLERDLSWVLHMMVVHPDRRSLVHRVGYQGEVLVVPWDEGLRSWMDVEGSGLKGRFRLSMYKLSDGLDIRRPCSM